LSFQKVHFSESTDFRKYGFQKVEFSESTVFRKYGFQKVKFSEMTVFRKLFDFSESTAINGVDKLRRSENNNNITQR